MAASEAQHGNRVLHLHTGRTHPVDGGPEPVDQGAGEIGIAFAAAGPGSLAGAALVGRMGRRLGVGRTIWVMQLLTGVSRLMIPLAVVATVPGGSLAVLAASNFLLGFARTVFNVTQVSLRVGITPDDLHGRMNATIRFLMWSVTPFGAFAGGILAASTIGLTATLWLAGTGVTLAVVPFLASELRTIREIRGPAG